MMAFLKLFLSLASIFLQLSHLPNATTSNPLLQNITITITIGYALPPKIEKTFIQPSLLSLAEQHGIFLLKIDQNKPLTNQGPFDCIIHKLYSKDWNNQLQLFSSIYPYVPIIDSPDSIKKLHDRVSIHEVVSQLEIRDSIEKLGIPNQVVVLEGEVRVSNQSLRFPVVAKPLNSSLHQMSLVLNKEELLELRGPIILQEFVNHGGVLFKCYVVGEYVKCVKRRSLSDIWGILKDGWCFSQISNLIDQEEGGNNEEVDRAEMPRSEFVEEVAQAIREVTRLSIFNFDMIRDAKDENRYLIIDINYFPWLAKLPGYESVMIDFFLRNDVVKKKNKNEYERSMVDQKNDWMILVHESMTPFAPICKRTFLSCSSENFPLLIQSRNSTTEFPCLKIRLSMEELGIPNQISYGCGEEEEEE